MVLAGEAFYHIGYLEMFNSTLPEAVYKLVDTTQNCDDIAMNVMVASYLEEQGQPQCPGIVVRGYTVKNLETEASKCLLFVHVLCGEAMTTLTNWCHIACSPHANHQHSTCHVCLCACIICLLHPCWYLV